MTSYPLQFVYDDPTPRNLLLKTTTPVVIPLRAPVRVTVSFPVPSYPVVPGDDPAFVLEQDYFSAGQGAVSIAGLQTIWSVADYNAVGGQFVFYGYGTGEPAWDPTGTFLFAMVGTIGAGSGIYPIGVLEVLSRRLVTKQGPTRGYFAANV